MFEPNAYNGKDANYLEDYFYAEVAGAINYTYYKLAEMLVLELGIIEQYQED